MIAFYNNLQPFNHSNSVFTHKQVSNFSLQSDVHGETEAKQIRNELSSLSFITESILVSCGNTLAGLWLVCMFC